MKDFPEKITSAIKDLAMENKITTKERKIKTKARLVEETTSAIISSMLLKNTDAAKDTLLKKWELVRAEWQTFRCCLKTTRKLQWSDIKIL